MEEHRTSTRFKFKTLWIVILIQGLIIAFIGGAMVQSYVFTKNEPKSITTEELRIALPRSEKELQKQYLLVLAQRQILEQMMKWDLYRLPQAKEPEKEMKTK